MPHFLSSCDFVGIEMASSASCSGSADVKSHKRCVENIEISLIANCCRDDINCGKGFTLKPTGGTARWREELTLKTVELVLLRQNTLKIGEWREVLKSAGAFVKDKYPLLSREITETVNQYLRKSPMQEFKRGIAYRWLKYVEKNRPVNVGWYPNLAVDVAHEVFRLQGNVEAFRKYLSKPARRNKLSSLRLPVNGWSNLPQRAL